MFNHTINRHFFLIALTRKGISNTAICALCFLTLCHSSLSIADIIHREPSLYQSILVDEKDDLRCIQFDVNAKNLNQTCVYKSQPKQLVFNYTKLLFSALLLNKQPADILIIGLGGGTMSNTLHQLFPESNITNIEIDPAMIKVARMYFDFIENNKVKTLAQDGRLFIKRAGLKQLTYDWIILDAFNGDYIPEHLLTQDFLFEAKALLKPDGILTSNTFAGSRLYDYESATYHSVFGEFFNIKSASNENRIILVGNQKLHPISNSILLQRDIKQLSVSLRPYGVILDDILSMMKLTTENHDWPSDTRILTDQYSPANLLKEQ